METLVAMALGGVGGLVALWLSHQRWFQDGKFPWEK